MNISSTLLVVMLIIVEEETNQGLCVLKMVDGKLQKYGDCNSRKQSQILNDLDHKVEKYERANHRSCADVKKPFATVKNDTGGVFNIYPEPSAKKIELYCDLDTDGGGWTVFQRRMDGSEDFYRDWDDYVKGFGRKDKEFWLGLENLHQMTKNGKYELRIELEDFRGNTVFAKYESFKITSSDENYRLNVGSHSGKAGDGFDWSNGKQFTTWDRDNDPWVNNCAQYHQSAWWYGQCTHSNLNGVYHNTNGAIREGVTWWSWKKDEENLRFTEMKFRRVG